jgi:hypothetical protein
MNTPLSTSKANWREFYRAAILGLDSTKLPQHIVEAEEAIVLRARELFHTAGDNAEETEALDDAMYALHALRSTMKFNPSSALTIRKQIEMKRA